ncbi:MAG: nucleotidyltransferase domain-containing protein [Candidatus Pacebacteria bacterium]|nr:nucleotidyltransferase domain-containing protein [Candidatus Paceibacterota bacterium]
MTLEELAKQNNIKYIVLFGSQVKGTQREDSDFDIAIFRDPFKSLEEYTNVLFGLADILGFCSDKIDLTNLKHADPLLRYEITTKGKLLYGNELDYEEFCAFAYKDYIDSKDLFDLRFELLEKRNKELQKYIKDN